MDALQTETQYFPCITMNVFLIIQLSQGLVQPKVLHPQTIWQLLSFKKHDPDNSFKKRIIRIRQYN